MSCDYNPLSQNLVRNGTVFLLVLLLGNVETKARVKPLVLVSQEDDASSDEDRRPQNLMIMPKAAYSVVESAVGITKDATVDALTAATTVATVTQASNEINETELNSVDGSGSGDMKPGIAAENTTTQPLEPRVSTEKMPFLNFTITDSVKSTEEPEFIVPDGLGGIIDYSLPPPNQKSEADSIDYFVDVEESVEDADSLLLHWDNHMPPNAIRPTETAPCLFEIWFYGPTNFVLPGQPLNISFPYLHDPPASEITMQTKKLLCRGEW
ncbi:unnamed protein product [Cyprideis torosa]|uniref:Uncharacterized protein n=1 Tax=Cyprideis torosa TaxID=163714 RepID=A0A7R8W295_9CRUS|nr:unnamed protein product [Cyprideis torosa]CAG0881738.1 unnamed protein product [Cyprideis torosa]